jgi:hypothetical protein
LRETHQLLEDGQWYQALFVLSKFFHRPELNSHQRQQLMDLLDPLAAKVVYSTEHLVESPHEVVRGETLSSIAQQYQIPAELLANINGLENPNLLVPGTRLKVLRGPFRAELNLASNELTLFLGDLYAGRFTFQPGKDPSPKPGEYRVRERQLGRVYYAGDGRTIALDDPANPYGGVWIGLEGELCIHGTSDAADAGSLGCIRLAQRDALDVYSILSSGSAVIIR